MQIVPPTTLQLTLTSISLLNGSYSASYNVVVTNNKASASTADIEDTVTVTNSVLSSLAGSSVSYGSLSIVGNVLTFPTTPVIAGNSTYSFTFTLKASVSPSVENLNVIQDFVVTKSGSSCCNKPVCFRIENSSEETDCDITYLQLDGNVTTTISSPGHYKVVNSPTRTISGITSFGITGLTETPNSFDQIVITSSNVYLDLCGHVLSGSGNQTRSYSPTSPSGASGPIGIQNDMRVDTCRGIIASGSTGSILNNITITNGLLQYYSAQAILCQFIDNINVTDITIQNSVSVMTLRLGALGFSSCYSTNVLNCKFLKNRCTDIYAFPNRPTTSPTDSQINSIVTIRNCTSVGLRGGLNNNSLASGSRTFTDFQNNLLTNQNFVDYGSICFAIVINSENSPSFKQTIIEDCSISNVKALIAVLGIFMTTGGSSYNLDPTIIRNVNINQLENPVSDLSFIGTAAFNPPNYEIQAISMGTQTIGCLIENCSVHDLNSKITKISYPAANQSTVMNSVIGYKFEKGSDRIIKNCTATNIRCSGLSTSLVPQQDILVSDYIVAGFTSQTDNQSSNNPPENTMFIDCQATNISGSTGSNATSAYGFAIFNTRNESTSNITTYSYTTLFKNCNAQECFGDNKSAGFGLRWRLNNSPTNPPYTSVIYDNCSSSSDRRRQPASALSNGFYVDATGNNIIFRNCLAEGHHVHGFNLSSYRRSGTIDGAKYILDNCVANGNDGRGFYLDSYVNSVELVNCKSTNNVGDGLYIGGRNVAIQDTKSDFNANNGVMIDEYYPFVAKVATDVTNANLENLGVYGSAYTVQYVPSSGFGRRQYFNIIPTSSTAPLPSNLTINSFPVVSGDVVLVKDLSGTNANVGGQRNGVYEASNYGGVVVSGNTVPVWQLTRVDPWRSVGTVVANTKILVQNSNVPNLSPGPVMYVLNNQVVVDTTNITAANLTAYDSANVYPDPSGVVVNKCTAFRNGSAGVRNKALDVVVRETTADRNNANGFVDSSIGGAQANYNLYARNRSFNNGDGSLLANYDVDYVTLSNPTVLSSNVFPIFPIGTGPETNLSITRV